MSFDSDRLDARSPSLIRALLTVLQPFTQFYLRLHRDGLEHVPSTPALFVANHNGGILGPDLLCTMATLWELRGVDAPVYGLAHDFAMRQLRPLGRVLQALGAMRASPRNAECALAAGAQVLVYPGGDLEAYRHSRLRDRIVLGTRTVFVRLAQRAGVPIVPIVAYGAHRSAYIFNDGAAIARFLRLHHWGRLDRFPLAFALPWGIAVGPWTPYLPLPFPIRLRILPPVTVGPSADPAVAREKIRASMQGALDALAHEAEG
ncbi:MAG: 1-acyl-sn-glycerol-3-phosphate acyltransferase [Candidatus Binatia bacterium]